MRVEMAEKRNRKHFTSVEQFSTLIQRQTFFRIWREKFGSSPVSSTMLIPAADSTILRQVWGIEQKSIRSKMTLLGRWLATYVGGEVISGFILKKMPQTETPSAKYQLFAKGEIEEWKKPDSIRDEDWE